MIEDDPRAIHSNGGFGTPLHEAVIWGRTDIVRYLLDRGADVESRSVDGKTPRELAVEQAANGRSHTPIVTEERRVEIERACGEIIQTLAGLKPRAG
jgi:hypothetical protein